MEEKDLATMLTAVCDFEAGKREGISEVLEWCEEHKGRTDIGIEYVPLADLKAKFGKKKIKGDHVGNRE